MQQNHDNNFTSAAVHKPKSKKNTSFEDDYGKIGKKAAPKSKIGGRAGGVEGEIIQVPGGHIIRATGGKDRHSKVYTSKGPRDRRVRLSANTAIQFYDVQDRLGYDRPSKAVDWLMNKAKEAIDKLDADVARDLPIVKMDHHHSPSDFNPGSNSNSAQEMDLEHQQESANMRYAFQLQRHLSGDLNTNSGIMVPGSNSGTQSMADSMKSFFPLNPGTSLMEMQSYSSHNNNNGIQTEDLGLLLQTHNQNQRSHHQSHTEMLLHHHEQQHHHQGSNSYDQTYNTKVETSWNNNNNNNLGGVQDENRVGFVFNNPNGFSSQNSSQQHQREPLQSNNYTQLLHSWNERMLPSVDHQQQQHNIVQQPTLLQPSYNLYFGSNFQIPAQIHGEPEEEEEEEEEEEDHSH